MNKKGFTLQEALITIGIIGIIAAITVPGLTKLLPNQNQTRFLKAYATLSDLTKQMLVDPTLYWTNSDDHDCDGLACWTMPVAGSVPDALLSNDFLGQFDPNPTPEQKYAAILAYNMHLSTNALGGANPAFITTDGVQWLIQNNGNNNIEVIIDVNGSNPPDHISPNQIDFDQDQFSIIVGMDGEIRFGDATGRAYIENEAINLSKRSRAGQALLAENDENNNAHPVYYVAALNNLCNQYPAFCRKNAPSGESVPYLDESKLRSESIPGFSPNPKNP